MEGVGDRSKSVNTGYLPPRNQRFHPFAALAKEKAGAKRKILMLTI
jgi:hypothetical protein